MNLLFHARFTKAKVGQAGLTPTVDVVRIARADGTATPIVTGGIAAEGSRGSYRYLLAGADLQLYDYVVTFITTDATVDLMEVAAVWTRFSEAVATDADGRVRIGVNDDKAGYALSDPGVDAVVDALATADPAGYADDPSAWIQQSINVGTGAGGGADPWGVALPGGYPPGSAGALVGSNLDAKVSSRSTYAGGPVASVAAPVTLAAGAVAAIDAALSGAHGAGAWDAAGAGGGVDQAGVQAALTAQGYTTTLAATIGTNLDARVSTRSTYAGGAVASVAAPVAIDLTQPLADTTAGTTGGALHGAWATAWGKAAKDVLGKVLSIFGAFSQTTPARTFDLDVGAAPTSRTPR